VAAHGATEVTAAADVTTVTSCRGQRAVSPGRLQRSVPFVVGHVSTATEILTLLRRRAGGQFSPAADTKLLAETGAEARSRMIDAARVVGANWVLGLRYGSSGTADDMSEIIAYRTAVRAVEIELGPADFNYGAGMDE
jgi:uncharacterized protein YbjQ (UPF0145 family)